MGQDKAWLDFDGEPLLVRILRIVSPVVSDVVIVASEYQRLPDLQQQHQVVIDLTPDSGPLGGVVTGIDALSDSPGPVFLCGCDHPFLSGGFLEALLDRMGDNDAVAVASSKPQPLCAWYRFRALASAIELFAAGERRLTGLYGSLNVTEVSNLEGVDLGTVTLGVNTPEDYSEALRRAGLAG